MKKRILGIIFSIVMLANTTIVAFPAVGYALFEGSKNQICQGANYGDTTSTTCDQTAGTKASTLLADVINIFSMVVGVIAVIMIIIGGLRYITSTGDSGNINSAKNTILYAIIGLVVVALAQIIVNFVLAKIDPALVKQQP